MGLIILGLILFAIGYIYYLSVQRDTKIWTEDINVTKNLTIPIEFKSSQRKYYGGHAFGWGGGDVKNHIKFQYHNIAYLNETPFIPVVVKFYEDTFYLIYFDRETHLRKITFRFYKSTSKGTFKEINASDFPKHLAIQNRWFKGYNSDPNDLIGLDPKKITGTMTSKIWYMIEGEQKLFEHHSPATIDFVKNYIEKYITNQKEKN